MERFPSYEEIIEYETEISKDGNSNKLLLNYIIQILRRNQIAHKLTSIESLINDISKISRVKNLPIDEASILSIIESNPKTFKVTINDVPEGVDHEIQLLPTAFKSEIDEMNLNHYEDYGEYEEILEKFKNPPNLHNIDNSIYIRAIKILQRQIDSGIKLTNNHKASKKLVSWESDIDILIELPEELTLDRIKLEFDSIQVQLENNGYSFISDRRTPFGSPVMKFKDCDSDNTIDIGHFINNKRYKTNLIQYYCNLDSEIEEAILLVLTWANRRKLNNSDSVGVNSYCHALMFITYLIIIGAVPNLRTIDKKGNYTKVDEIEYYPQLDSLKISKIEDICSKYDGLSIDEKIDIPTYYHKKLEFELPEYWDIQEALKGYFYFMSFKFDYLTWDISIYHGGVIQSSESIDLIDKNTKLLRVRDPFNPDQIVSSDALPWWIDGLKWEFMRGYRLLYRGDWNELYHEEITSSVEDVYEYNMYTYTSLC